MFKDFSDKIKEKILFNLNYLTVKKNVNKSPKMLILILFD
jgi:hypothetical protein